MGSTDLPTIVVSLIIVAALFFMATFFGHKIYDKMGTVPMINQSGATMNVLNTAEQKFQKFDYLYFATFIGLVIMVIASAWMIASDPVFAIIYTSFIIIVIIVTWMAQQFMIEFFNNVLFENTIAEFPIMNHIINNLAMYITIIGLISLIVIYAKPRYYDQGGGGSIAGY